MATVGDDDAGADADADADADALPPERRTHDIPMTTKGRRDLKFR